MRLISHYHYHYYFDNSQHKLNCVSIYKISIRILILVAGDFHYHCSTFAHQFTKSSCWSASELASFIANTTSYFYYCYTWAPHTANLKGALAPSNDFHSSMNSKPVHWLQNTAKHNIALHCFLASAEVFSTQLHVTWIKKSTVLLSLAFCIICTEQDFRASPSMELVFDDCDLQKQNYLAGNWHLQHCTTQIKIQIQIQKNTNTKYTNTAYYEVPERLNMWYIFG